jgi:hypothetical protein
MFGSKLSVPSASMGEMRVGCRPREDLGTSKIVQADADLPRRDDVTCKHAVEATTSTIISGITLSSSSEAGTIELNACFHCQRSATPSQCGIRKLQVTHDGTIRLVGVNHILSLVSYTPSFPIL